MPCTRTVVPGWVCRVGTRVGIRGGYGWVGMGEGYTGTHPAARGEVHMTAKRAPEALQGWSGWSYVARARLVLHPPSGPGRAPVPSLVQDPAFHRLWANKARFHLIFYKVSQNRRVSPVFINKACHSPCFQKRLQNSPLEILRFPKSLAFSHKELMGLF